MELVQITGPPQFDRDFQLVFCNEWILLSKDAVIDQDKRQNIRPVVVVFKKISITCSLIDNTTPPVKTDTISSGIVMRNQCQPTDIPFQSTQFELSPYKHRVGSQRSQNLADELLEFMSHNNHLLDKRLQSCFTLSIKLIYRTVAWNHSIDKNLELFLQIVGKDVLTIIRQY